MRSRRGIPVFYYHSVGRGPLSLGPELFRRQMAYLKRRGFVGTSVIDIFDALARGDDARSLVGLTFDDGFQSVHQWAAPILEEFGFKATFYIATGYLGATLWGDTATGRWRTERFDGGVPFAMMDWPRVKDLAARGMEIGSHTCSHSNLTELPLDRARWELAESKRLLEAELAAPVRSFCYPRGKIDDALAGLARDAGYECACTTALGEVLPGADAFRWPRVPGYGNMSDFAFAAEGLRGGTLAAGALRVARLVERALASR